MATLSTEDRKRIKKQLASIKERLNEIKNSRNPSNLNAAQIGGASGIGLGR